MEELNPDYAVSRYPDAANGIPARVYNVKKAGIKLAAAQKVMKWVRNQLS
ncbi:MAG TPA: hypothetical protein VI874_00545 [Candidatus Norongarragalinales archaeon]|nr:hypothetical protein [Candidatus Norongarragalinales archaeon]